MDVDIGRVSKRVVQFFWDPLPKNDDLSGEPIWCLGRRYEARSSSRAGRQACSQSVHPSSSSTSHGSDAPYTGSDSGGASGEDSSARSEVADEDGGWPPLFLDDFESRLWLTYRSNFPPIAKSRDPRASAAMSFSVRLKSQLANQGSFTSDTGWGCMIRSGQCLLANALVSLSLGREWRRGFKPEDERRILSLFADDPRAPFSIHKFVEHGASACGKHPGEWFGPSATARCIQALSNNYQNIPLKVYITGDGSDVYEDKFFQVAKSADGSFQPTLVLLGIRLGIDRVTPVYWEALKASLQMPQSIGIAGGRPSSSHYFVGTQGQYFFYLDPHTTRPALPLHERIEEYSDDEIESCHTRRLRRIHVKEMDPSMLIAFLIRDEANWQAWREGVTQVQGKPVIQVADNEPAMHGLGTERESAIDEVETFDDDDDDGGLA